MQEQKKKRIVDGRFQIGILYDWIKKQNIQKDEEYLYMTIAYNMCQKFHKRSPNISLDTFDMSKPTLTKFRKKLIDRGWLQFKRTKAYSSYKLIEPKEILDTFYFSSEKENNTKQNKTEEIKSNIFG
jgi:hypothetical protein